MHSSALIGVSLHESAAAKSFVGKRITPHSLISGWLGFISLGTLIMEVSE